MHPMIGAPPFPRSLDELDSTFLTTALGFEVTGFTATQIGADRGMLGEIHLLELESAEARPSRLVAKFAADRAGSLDSAKRGGTHERELRCYAELLSSTPVRHPDFHGAWYDPESAHFLLLQQAVPVDPSVDQIDGVSVEQAEMVLREVARLHARWWEAPEIAEATWLPGLDSDQRIGNLTTIARAGWSRVVEVCGDELTSDELSLGTRLAAELEAMLRATAQLPSTLIHSDLRADNLLFSPDGSSVTLIDWQGAGIGPPGFDLAYFLSQSLTVDDRRAHEDDLLDFYRSELAAAGLQLSDEEVRAGYGQSMIYGMAVGCAIPLISDPHEPRARALTRVVVRRAIEGMRDHATLWEDT